MTRTFVIAEAGSCHDMEFEKAARLIETAASCGADAVKFQYWSSARRMARRRHAEAYLAAYENYALPEGWLERLQALAAERGIEFMCSTYLPEDVEVADPYVRRFKIASFEANDPVHLAAHVAFAKEKPVIVSCGLGASVGVVEEYLVRRVADAARVSYLLCVSAYPAPLNELGLERLRWSGWTAQRKADPGTPLYTGFSDHSAPTQVMTGAVAVAAGAQIVERHFRLSDTDPRNPDFPHAAPPEALSAYVHMIRDAEAALEWRAFPNDVAPSEQPLRGYRVRE